VSHQKEGRGNFSEEERVTRARSILKKGPGGKVYSKYGKRPKKDSFGGAQPGVAVDQSPAWIIMLVNRRGAKKLLKKGAGREFEGKRMQARIGGCPRGTPSKVRGQRSIYMGEGK